MSSIYQLALGSEFEKLHPQIQMRFGFGSEDGIAAIGRGTMDKVWHGAPYTLPFLMIGASRNIMFPQQGSRIPFTIENYAYRDGFGRETVTWIRKYFFPNKTRRFDATMIYSNERKRIVDYLGVRQHLAVDIELETAKNGGLHLRSGEQRFYEGILGFSFPMSFSGYADVTEWFDDDTNEFRISVEVRNRIWGKLFGYEGHFTVEYLKIASPRDVPADVKPLREQIRE